MNRVPARVVASPGDRIGAEDLQALAQRPTAFGALHVSGVHNTWGIGRGLTLSIADDGRSVDVAAGVAWDRCGREIVVEQTFVLEGHRVNEHMAVVVSAEDPKPHWLPAGSHRPGFDLILGVFDADPSQLDMRSGGRSPHAGRGATVAAGVVRSGSIPVAGTASAWSARIQTGAPKFDRTPIYFVQLGLPAAGQPVASTLPWITAEYPNGFDLTVITQFEPVLASAYYFDLPVDITWLAVDPDPGSLP